MEIYQYIGKRIQTYRSERHMSQQELAQALGTHANTISRWETATYKPSLEDLLRLAEYFGVSLVMFLPLEHDMYRIGRAHALEAVQREVERLRNDS